MERAMAKQAFILTDIELFIDFIPPVCYIHFDIHETSFSKHQQEK